MKKKWQPKREYEATKPEARFEQLLAENGFNVVGVKEWWEKTDYLIEKDGIECPFNIHRVDNKPSRGDSCFKSFEEFYNLKKEYEKLKQKEGTTI